VRRNFRAREDDTVLYTGTGADAGVGADGDVRTDFSGAMYAGGGVDVDWWDDVGAVVGTGGEGCQ